MSTINEKEIIDKHIPDWIQWHEVCRERVLKVIEEIKQHYEQKSNNNNSRRTSNN